MLNGYPHSMPLAVCPACKVEVSALRSVYAAHSPVNRNANLVLCYVPMGHDDCWVCPASYTEVQLAEPKTKKRRAAA